MLLLICATELSLIAIPVLFLTIKLFLIWIFLMEAPYCSVPIEMALSMLLNKKLPSIKTLLQAFKSIASSEHTCLLV